jgi:predicted secreted protein
VVEVVADDVARRVVGVENSPTNAVFDVDTPAIGRTPEGISST